MKTIPEEFVSPLCRILKQQKTSLEVVKNMSQEERVQLLAQMEGNENIRAMLESKEFKEIAEDLEIQQMLNGLEETLANDIRVIDEVFKILDSETVESNS